MLITIVLATLAIIVLVVCLKRYFLTALRWPETILPGIAASMLIWADRTFNYLDIALFLSRVIFRFFHTETKSPFFLI